MNNQNSSETPEISEALKEFFRLREILRKIIPKDFVYIPRGAEQYLKVGTPDELMDPLSDALIFPLPLSEEDEKEALAHAEKCGITIPEKYLRNRKPSTCSCGHNH